MSVTVLTGDCRDILRTLPDESVQNLHLNRKLMRQSHWDEAAILERGRELFEIARRIWRGPDLQSR